MRRTLLNYNYNRLLNLFHKLYSRLNRNIFRGRFSELSSNQQSWQLHRLDKLRMQLSRMEQKLKYGGLTIAVSTGINLIPSETYAQIAPAGAEFRVNTFTVGVQMYSKVAMDADGDFVVTWASRGQADPEYDIYAQSYTAQGLPKSPEFRVNTTIGNRQTSPVIAMDDDGDFVIVWTSTAQDGNSGGVFLQRYNASGVAQGSEFQVNTTTAGNQYAPAVAMDSDGDFAVSWSGPDAHQYGIFTRLFNSAGNAKTGEIQVNTYFSGVQRFSSIAMDDQGDFVVAWQSSQDGSSYGIYAQRYNNSGVAQGSEFQVNTYTTGGQKIPSVAMDKAGDFVVSWSSPQDGNGYGVYAQRYNSSGAAQGSEFQVNTTTSGSQNSPAVALSKNGDFIISWGSASMTGESDGAIAAQKFSAAGVTQGAEFKVNTYTTGLQSAPFVAIDNDGDFVITWNSDAQDGSGNGVYAQRYEENLAPSDIEISNDTINENVEATTIVGTFNSADPDNDKSFSYSLVGGAGSTDNAAFTIVDNKLLVKISPDFETKSYLTIRVRTTDAGGLYFEKALAITIKNVNEAPSAIALSANSVDENVVANSVVGTFSTTDADAADTFTYTFTAGTGDADNASFAIVGNKLQIKAIPDFETKSSYSIRVRSSDKLGLYFEKTFTVSVKNVNEAPFAIALSANSVDENVVANSEVGTFTTTDADASDTFTYTFTAGTGDSDNASFSIVGNKLQIKASPDFETKSSYIIRIRSSDKLGLYFEKAFTISIKNVNEAPSALGLSANSVDENVAANSEVGTFTTTDADASDTFTYTFTAGTGDSDNASFSIVGNKLQIKASPDFETKSSYSIRVRSSDKLGLYFEKMFTVSVKNVNEAPFAIALSANSVDENVAANTEVGTFTTTDADAADTFTYTLVAGTGDLDNASFLIVGNKLQIKVRPDFETKKSHSIRVVAADAGGLKIEKEFVISINDIIELSTTEVADFSSAIKMYPNPAKDIVQTNLEGIFSVKITDLAGHVVKEETVNNQTISVEGLSSGIYMMEFTQNNKIGMKKLVID